MLSTQREEQFPCTECITLSICKALYDETTKYGCMIELSMKCKLMSEWIELYRNNVAACVEYLKKEFTR